MTAQSALGRRTLLADLGALSVATVVGCNASAGGAGSDASPSAAVDKVKAAVAAKPDLTVLGISRSADNIWIANVAQHPDLAYLEKLGVRFVDAKVSDPSLYFNEVSYEKIDEFSGDVIFDDSRGGVVAAADKQPTWKALPAVKAGQVHAWKPAAPYSYKANAPISTEFADALSNASKAT